MKTVYLLIHYWCDFESHNDVLGVYETEELAEKAKEDWLDTHKYPSYDEESDDLEIEEVTLNCFVWER